MNNVSIMPIDVCCLNDWFMNNWAIDNIGFFCGIFKRQENAFVHTSIILDIHAPKCIDMYHPKRDIILASMSMYIPK